MQNSRREDAQPTGKGAQVMANEEVAELRRQLEDMGSTVSSLLTRSELSFERLERVEQTLTDTTQALRSTLEHLDNVLRGDGSGKIGMTVRIDRIEQSLVEHKAQEDRRHTTWSRITIGIIVTTVAMAIDRLADLISGRSHP